MKCHSYMSALKNITNITNSLSYNHTDASKSAEKIPTNLQPSAPVPTLQNKKDSDSGLIDNGMSLTNGNVENKDKSLLETKHQTQIEPRKIQPNQRITNLNELKSKTDTNPKTGQSPHHAVTSTNLNNLNCNYNNIENINVNELNSLNNNLSDLNLISGKVSQQAVVLIQNKMTNDTRLQITDKLRNSSLNGNGKINNLKEIGILLPGISTPPFLGLE